MLNHKGTIEIKTPRLILRQFVEDDAPAMYKNWASSDLVTKYVTWFSHKNIEETQQVISMWVDEYKDINRYQWAIVLREINEPIGSIGVVRQKEDVAAAEMGYCIGDKFWHKGFTSEALSAVMLYLFEEVGFNRISAIHDIRNPHSGDVMKKCGMNYEGTHREVALTKEGELLSVCEYAALKREWMLKDENHG